MTAPRRAVPRAAPHLHRRARHRRRASPVRVGGIGPWQDYPPLTEYTRLSVPSPDAFYALKYKVANLDNVQLQLCQPPELDCPQRRFLDAHGEGVFHIGFESGLDAAAAAGTALGLDVLARGQRDNGSGFIYFDTYDRAGVVLLARQTAR